MVGESMGVGLALDNIVWCEKRDNKSYTRYLFSFPTPPSLRHAGGLASIFLHNPARAPPLPTYS